MRKIIIREKIEECFEGFEFMHLDYPELSREASMVLLNNPSYTEIRNELCNIKEKMLEIPLAVFVPDAHKYQIKTLFDNVFVLDELSSESLERVISVEYEIGKPVTFSQREEMFLKEIAYGLSNKELSDQLSISDRSVRRMKEKLLSKTGLANSQQLILYAINNGF